jgi:hypothetical protein
MSTEPSTAEPLNFCQKFIEMLRANWSLQGDESADNIFFAWYMIDPTIRFSSGKMIVIEIYPIAGTGKLTSISSNKVNDVFKLDYWIKLDNTSDEGRRNAENQRARIKKTILDLIHNNQTQISNLNIAIFTRFVHADEVQNKPITLHESIFITGEYFHTLSSS